MKCAIDLLLTDVTTVLNNPLSGNHDVPNGF